MTQSLCTGVRYDKVARYINEEIIEVGLNLTEKAVTVESERYKGLLAALGKSHVRGKADVSWNLEPETRVDKAEL